MEELVLVCVWI